jgi:hypothetical protein
VRSGYSLAANRPGRRRHGDAGVRSLLAWRIVTRGRAGETPDARAGEGRARPRRALPGAPAGDAAAGGRASVTGRLTMSHPGIAAISWTIS